MSMRIFAVIALFLASTSSYAVPVRIDFNATFATGPVAALSGSFFYEAATLEGQIEALTGVDLAINGHTYTLDEIGFENGVVSQGIAGVETGLRQLAGYTDDFWFFFDSTNVYNAFSYTTLSSNDSFAANSLGFQRSLGSASVPEPGTLALFGLGLIGAAVGHRRRRGVAA